MSDPTDEFRQGVIEAMAEALTEHGLHVENLGFLDTETLSGLLAKIALDAALNFRLPDQPEGPRVAVVVPTLQNYAVVQDGPNTTVRLRTDLFTLFPATPETPEGEQ